ncbi:MAG: hypothetical protein ACKV0T_23480 [Planctomycetales bacterium]
MFRSLKSSALLAAALAPLLALSAQAQNPVQQTTYAARNRAMSYGTLDNGLPADGNSYGYNHSNGYAPIQAPLYPSPKPDVPYEVGRTMITNPALAPHEMLYPHTYHALYGPYYYRNKCGLNCVPFFPKPKLRGTEVTVKYKSCHGLFDCWYPPCSRSFYSNRQWR